MVSIVLPPNSCTPQQKRSYVSVKVNVEAFKSRLDLCQFSLIGRLILAKGDKPYALSSLKEKLNAVWKLLASWRLISLGKGYYQVLLSSHEDRSRIWGMGSLNLKPGVWRLQPWDKNFNPYSPQKYKCAGMGRLWDLP